MGNDVKIAIVDLIRVLDQSQLGVSGAQKIEALYQNQQRELAPLIASAKSSKKPSDAKQLETRAREHEAERERLRAELRQALLDKAQPIVSELSLSAGVDFVLARPQALLFAKPELDL